MLKLIERLIPAPPTDQQVQEAAQHALWEHEGKQGLQGAIERLQVMVNNLGARRSIQKQILPDHLIHPDHLGQINQARQNQ